MSAEPWFAVGPDDVFPEELMSFLIPSGSLREEFQKLHPELYDPKWWSARQADIRAGVQPDLFPYPESVRFSHRKDAGTLGR